MARRLVLLLGSALGSGCEGEAPPAVPACLPDPAPSAGADGGNVVIILMDDLGVDKVGVYGVHPTPAPTPRLDALAARGLRFVSAYAEPLCSPGRAALLTGRRPFHTGVGDNVHDVGGLPEEELTLPEALRGAPGGPWSSAAVGKWHLSPVDGDAPRAPLRQGFDRFDGLLANPRVTLEDWSVDRSYFRWERDLDGALSLSTEYLTTAQANAAIEAVQTLPEPFFLYVAFSAAHVPLHEPPADLWSVADPTDGDAGLGDAMIEALDHEIGRLVDAIGDRATVFVTSDNGTSDPLLRPPADADRGKHSVYTGGAHVPLFVVGPGIEPGTSEALVHVTDLFPTVLDLAGVDPGGIGVELDGRSLRPLLEGRADSVRRCVMVERFASDGVPSHHSWVSVQDEDYALVRGPGVPDELYQRTPELPTEGVDLLGLPRAPGDAAAALRRLRTWLRRDLSDAG